MPSFVKNTPGGKVISGGALAPRSRRGNTNQVNDYWSGGVSSNPTPNVQFLVVAGGGGGGSDNGTGAGCGGGGAGGAGGTGGSAGDLPVGQGGASGYSLNGTNYTSLNGYVLGPQKSNP